MGALRWLGPATVALGLVVGCGAKNSSSSTTTTTVAGSSTSSPTFSGSSNSKYCNLARQFTGAINPALSKDPKTAFQQFDSLATQFLAVVPPQIRVDAQTVVDAGKQLETTVAAVNYDVTKLKPSDLAPLQDPKVAAAASRINAYNTQVCGLTTPTS